MHPIEHLRYVARARGIDPTELVREAATALGSLRADGPGLVVACRRIVERHPEVGAMWWLCARLLTSDDPRRLAWDLADQVDSDEVAHQVALAVPLDATVLTVGWPVVGGEGLMRRGDVRVLCADSRHTASSFMQRLERSEIECEPVAPESLARAIAVADLVLVEAAAASPQRVLAPIGSHVVAAVAASIGVPVWCVVGVGNRLPVEYVDAIAERVAPSSAWDPIDDAELDDLPAHLITHVVSVDGLTSDVGDGLRPECPMAPELLRTSPL